jgi:hypothetical protein
MLQRAPHPNFCNNIISCLDVKTQVSKRISITANMQRRSNNPEQNWDAAYDSPKAVYENEHVNVNVHVCVDVLVLVDMVGFSNR